MISHDEVLCDGRIVRDAGVTDSERNWPVEIVKGLAAGSKVIPLTAVSAESEISVILEEANVAVSVDLFGMVAGDQLSAVFQSPLPGLKLQVALPAWLV